MRILCITPWFPRHRQDQTGNFILDSLESLVEMGHEIVVLVTEPWRPKVVHGFRQEWKRDARQAQDFSEALKLHQSQYFSIPRGYFSAVSLASYRWFINPVLKQIVHQFKPQLIHAHTELAGIAAVDVGQAVKIPTVMTVHGISTDQKLYHGYSRKTLFEYTFSHSDRVVMVGEPLVQFGQQFVKQQHHFRVVHNGFRQVQTSDLVRVKNAFGSPIRFISVSNLQEGKGIDINLYALAKLKQQGIVNWQYKIIGDGSERQKLEYLAQSLGLAQQVVFVGACHHHAVYAHHEQADVFILPSYREAFGVAYLEAMASGLLTIGVAGQGPNAFIEDGKTGFLIPPKSAEQLAICLQAIFAAPDKMQTIAQAGKEHVRRHFTWQHHAKKLTSIYQELITES